MSLDPIKTKKFRDALAKKPREELLRIIKIQDKETYNQVIQIEDVFRTKLTHLKWSDGSPIEGKDFTNAELALLIDEPFQVVDELLDMGINAEKQKELHVISDPVTWAKTFLRDEDGNPVSPRVYQILPMRDAGLRKVLRWGRRCLVAGTEVMTTKGIKNIEDIVPGDLVYNEHGEPIKVLELVPQGEQEVVDITHNKKIIATSTLDHRWLFSNGGDPYLATPSTADKENLCIEKRFVKAPLGAIRFPEAYKLGSSSKEQPISVLKSWDRYSLLNYMAGLVDTRGSVTDPKTTLYISILAQSEKELESFIWASKSLWQHEPEIDGLRIDFKATQHCVRILRELSPYIKSPQKRFKSQYNFLLKGENQTAIPIEFGDKYLADTYDISVDSPTQLYVLANEGLVTHNTGKSYYMALTMVHKAMTIPNYKVIVVAPQIKHTKILYDEIVNIIKNNEYVESNVSRYIQSPSPEINFTTGSFIRFFTAGTKSAGNADSARGQEADLIILDEMDYLHPDDLVALLAMLQDTKKDKNKKVLIGASTPTGSHEVFYNWCTAKDSIFTEFYMPSYCNPQWSPELEAEMRNLYRTTNSYRHEIEADWGENAEGVYPRGYLDSAFDRDNEWEYVDHRTGGDSDFFIGVDWDKYGAGTNIVVLERYSKNHSDKSLAGKFRLAFREETTREEFTYTNAVRRVIELNERFNPKFIYVDRGAGEVQVELLHEAGMANPFSGLGKKVKGISFKEIIEARDPFTKQVRRMETKPFMVDNLYQFFENQLLAIPYEDSELYHQLLSYVVLRTSQNGNPVFGSLNDNADHAHDALLLACLAFTENYGDFFNVTLSAEPKALSNKFFMPMYAGEAGKKENSDKIRSENPSIPSPYEPPDAIIDEQPSRITRSIPFASRGSKTAIRRKSF